MAYSTQNKEDRVFRTIEAWVANPLATYEEIARKAGISDKTFWRYRQDPEFMEEYHKRCEQRFRSLESKAIALLDGELDSKNWNAIKYVLDGTGYKPTDKSEVKVDDGLTIKVEVEE